MRAAALAVRTPLKLAGSKGGVAWSVQYKEFSSLTLPATVVYFRGAPPYWRERGTGAHFITSRYLTGSRTARGLRAAEHTIGVGGLLKRKDGPSNSSRAVLHFPDGGYATKVAVKGLAPRPFWEETERTIQASSVEIYQAETLKALLTAGFN